MMTVIKKIQNLNNVFFSLVLSCMAISGSVIIYFIGKYIFNLNLIVSPDYTLEGLTTFSLAWKYLYGCIVYPVVETYLFYKYPIKLMKHLKWSYLFIFLTCIILYLIPNFLMSGVAGFGSLILSFLLPYAFLSRMGMENKNAFLSTALIHIFHDTFFITANYINFFLK